MTGTSQHHLLLFEPRVEGHHLTWLRYLTEDFLAGGFRLTLALDWRPGTRELIQDQLALLMDEIAIVSIFNQDGRLRGRNKRKRATRPQISKMGFIFVLDFWRIEITR